MHYFSLFATDDGKDWLQNHFKTKQQPHERLHCISKVCKYIVSYNAGLKILVRVKGRKDATDQRDRCCQGIVVIAAIPLFDPVW